MFSSHSESLFLFFLTAITYSTETKKVILSLTVFDYVSLLSFFNPPPLSQTSPHTPSSATTTRCGQLFHQLFGILFFIYISVCLLSDLFPCFSLSLSVSREISFYALGRSSLDPSARHFFFIQRLPDFCTFVPLCASKSDHRALLLCVELFGLCNSGTNTSVGWVEWVCTCMRLLLIDSSRAPGLFSV